MHYPLATCDPNDFQSDRLSFRQVLYDPRRRIELAIIMTMYNEDEELFCRTMHGVMKNVAHLCKRARSKTSGKDGWEKVVMYKSEHSSVVVFCSPVQMPVEDKNVTAHIREYTAQSTSPSPFPLFHLIMQSASHL